jgi:hypothetical protein
MGSWPHIGRGMLESDPLKDPGSAFAGWPQRVPAPAPLSTRIAKRAALIGGLLRPVIAMVSGLAVGTS